MFPVSIHPERMFKYFLTHSLLSCSCVAKSLLLCWLYVESYTDLLVASDDDRVTFETSAHFKHLFDQ